FFNFNYSVIAFVLLRSYICKACFSIFHLKYFNHHVLKVKTSQGLKLSLKSILQRCIHYHIVLNSIPASRIWSTVLVFSWSFPANSLSKEMHLSGFRETISFTIASVILVSATTTSLPFTT